MVINNGSKNSKCRPKLDNKWEVAVTLRTRREREREREGKKESEVIGLHAVEVQKRKKEWGLRGFQTIWLHYKGRLSLTAAWCMCVCQDTSPRWTKTSSWWWPWKWQGTRMTRHCGKPLPRIPSWNTGSSSCSCFPFTWIISAAPRQLAILLVSNICKCYSVMTG